MGMPNDLILVRHGHSEGNLALGNAKKGDESLLTPDFRETPGYKWRLTEEGRKQAQLAGQWIIENFPDRFDRYYVSPYLRTIETAALLDLPEADWRIDQRLRERDWGEINSTTPTEHSKCYPQNALVKKIDALYWRPPAGESIADVRLRVRNFVDTLHRECDGSTVIVVTHGEFMSAVRASFEYMNDEEWVSADSDKAFKIHNTHIYHYTRRNPKTGDIGSYLSYRRDVCPFKEHNCKGNWQTINRRRFTNDQLYNFLDA